MSALDMYYPTCTNMQGAQSTELRPQQSKTVPTTPDKNVSKPSRAKEEDLFISEPILEFLSVEEYRRVEGALYFKAVYSSTLVIYYPTPSVR